LPAESNKKYFSIIRKDPQTPCNGGFISGSLTFMEIPEDPVPEMRSGIFSPRRRGEPKEGRVKVQATIKNSKFGIWK